MYKVDSNTRKCVSSRIPDSRQWRPFGVPKNATYLQQEMIGVPGSSFLAHEYIIRSENHPENCEWGTGCTLFVGLITAMSSLDEGRGVVGAWHANQLPIK